MRLDKRVYWTWVSLVIDLLAFTCILPLFPRILNHYAEQENDQLFSWMLEQTRSVKTLLGLSEATLDIVLFGGLLGSLFSFLQFLAAPVIGYATDSLGRRPVLLLCLLGTFASYVLWFCAQSFQIFVLSRIVSGLTKGIVQISTLIVTDVTSDSDRSSGMALIGVAFSIGFTAGPALGALFATERFDYLIPSALAPYSNPFSGPAMFSALMTLLNMFVVLFFISESRPSTTKITQQHKTNPQQKSILRKLELIHFAFLFFFSGAEFTITFLTFERFAFSNMMNGRLLGFIGLCSSLIQGGWLRRAATKQGENHIIGRSLAILILGLLGFAFCQDVWQLYGAGMLFSVASATVVPCLNTLTSFHSPIETRGATLGSMRSSGQLGRAFGPFSVCVLYWWYGAQITYIVTAVGILLVWLLLHRPLSVTLDKLKAA